MSKSKRFTKSSILPVLSELESSGLTVKDFAMQRDLSPHTLYRWRARIRKAQASEMPPSTRFVEIDIPAFQPPVASSGFQLILEGAPSYRLLISDSFDAADLQRLLSVLHGPC